MVVSATLVGLVDTLASDKHELEKIHAFMQLAYRYGFDAIDKATHVETGQLLWLFPNQTFYWNLFFKSLKTLNP